MTEAPLGQELVLLQLLLNLLMIDPKAAPPSTNLGTRISNSPILSNINDPLIRCPATASTIYSPTNSATTSSFIENHLTVATLNIRGQTGLAIPKQKQIEDFIKTYKVDILHCQEIEIDQSTFEDCQFISSSFDILPNNSPTNKYGTATLIRNDLSVDNINQDTQGRVLTFDVGNVTFCNLYLHSGNDRVMRANRESYLAETIPQILINSKPSGCISGDFNCITDKQDATRNPEAKLSPSLKRLMKTFCWTDSFRRLFPNTRQFSRYYEHDRFGEGATRIDRVYQYGNIIVKEAFYVGVAFSDHLGLIVKYTLPENFGTQKSPKSCPLFKANPDIVKDSIFQARLRENFILWSEVKENLNLEILTWWEKVC